MHQTRLTPSNIWKRAKRGKRKKKIVSRYVGEQDTNERGSHRAPVVDIRPEATSFIREAFVVHGFHFTITPRLDDTTRWFNDPKTTGQSGHAETRNGIWTDVPGKNHTAVKRSRLHDARMSGSTAVHTCVSFLAMSKRPHRKLTRVTQGTFHASPSLLFIKAQTTAWNRKRGTSSRFLALVADGIQHQEVINSEDKDRERERERR